MLSRTRIKFDTSRDSCFISEDILFISINIKQNKSTALPAKSDSDVMFVYKVSRDL